MRNDLPKQTFDKIMSKSVHLKVCKYCKQTIGEIKVLIPQYGRVGALVVCPTCGAETKLHGISQCFFSEKSMGTPILNGSIISGINKAVKDWNGGLYGYRTKGSKTLRDLDGKEIDNIGNGVIVLPCKVGDMVYELKANGRIVKGIVQSIHQNLVGNEQGRWIVTSWFDNYYADSKKAGFECGSHLYSPFEDFGKTVFLTKEEAEKALRSVRTVSVREKLVEIIQNSVGGCARHWAEVIADGLIAHGVTIKDVPDTNVGEWIKNGWNDYSCSVCGCQLIGHGASLWKYCPHCGAKMMPNRQKENDYGEVY